MFCGDESKLQSRYTCDEKFYQEPNEMLTDNVRSQKIAVYAVFNIWPSFGYSCLED